jgi:hypothetical protein
LVVDCVAKGNDRLQSVQVKIHQREAARALYQFLAEIGRFPDPLPVIRTDGSSVFSDPHQPFISYDKESA